MKVFGWRITGLVAIGIALLFAAVIAAMGFNEEAIRYLVRDTARISVILFLLAFAASSLNILLGRRWTAWLLANRRYMGVSFAISHTAHLLALAALYVWFPHPFIEVSLMRVAVIGGGLAYLVIFAMALTSFERTAAMIGPRAWRILHTLGAYYIWVVFAQSYIPRAFKQFQLPPESRSPWYIPLAAALILTIMLRAAAWLATCSKAAETQKAAA